MTHKETILNLIHRVNSEKKEMLIAGDNLAYTSLNGVFFCRVCGSADVFMKKIKHDEGCRVIEWQKARENG